MEQWQRTGIRLVFILVVSAIFIATAAFVALAIVSKAPEPTPANLSHPEQLIEVDGRTIMLRIDPEKAVIMSAEQSSTIDPEQVQELDFQIEAVDTQLEVEPTLSPTATPIPEPLIFVDYLVRQGDSLYSIGIEQNSSIELLAMYGVDADDLISGNMLNLPVANPSYCPGSRAYVVRDHDTAYGIARAFNTTSEAIMAINNFQAGYVIKVTEVICVPVA
ncbi:MAG: LysM peptidoglycan-binding domain-containing protein [Candidatus Promineifilaceae bacterium]